MSTGDLLLLRGNEITELFRGQEAAIIEAVKAAYVAHEQGDVSIPNCAFLRFPNNETDRIIPKPAFLGGSFQIAGLKWIASFPENVERGNERASATLIINSTETGVPLAVMEGSVISAYRTAASAALGVTVLRGSRPVVTLGIIGCGLINFETLRFLLKSRPEIKKVLLFDLSRDRALKYRSKCAELSANLDISLQDTASAIFEGTDVVSVATTATTPHLNSLYSCGTNSVILHISLRDFTPEAVLMAENVVDDVDHACSNRTSLDLTAKRQGNRDFIRATIGAILSGKQPPRGGDKPVLFSPFGLGILDLAVAHLAVQLARERNTGTIISNFQPTAWIARRY